MTGTLINHLTAILSILQQSFIVLIYQVFPYPGPLIIVFVACSMFLTLGPAFITCGMGGLVPVFIACSSMFGLSNHLLTLVLKVTNSGLKAPVTSWLLKLQCSVV